LVLATDFDQWQTHDFVLFAEIVRKSASTPVASQPFSSQHDASSTAGGALGSLGKFSVTAIFGAVLTREMHVKILILWMVSSTDVFPTHLATFALLSGIVR